MGREELDPRPAADRGEILPQPDRFARVVAGARHVEQADLVGLGFLLARERQGDEQRGADARGHGHPLVAERGAEPGHPEADQQFPRHPLDAVACDRVRDLVPEHRGELSVVLRDPEQARVHPDLAAGEREGVRILVLEDDELPVPVGMRRDGGDAAADFAHPSVQFGIPRYLSLGEDLAPGGEAELEVPALGQDQELRTAGLRRRGAAGEQDARAHEGKERTLPSSGRQETHSRNGAGRRGTGRTAPNRRIVDLTLPIRPHFRWNVERSQAGDFAKGDIFQITRIGFPVHAFTHMDSPRHFVPDGPTTSDIPLAATIGEAAVVDLADVAPMTAIGAAMLAPRAEHLREGDIALLRTGWYARRSIDDPAFWRDAPWLERDAAVWLRERGIRACGFDFPQDFTIRLLLDGEVRPREEHVTHFELLAHGVILIEYLTNTLQLVSERVEFLALPLAVPEADGAPVRAIAFEDEAA